MRAPIPFGKYLLLERISVGGMAEVFKAKSFGVEGFEKIIAIKRILPSMAEDADFVEMFIDEAKIAGQLSHANICQIFELGKLDGTHFIAMEYIWGKDLLQISNRLRKLGQKVLTSMACFVVAKVCEALDYAHRRKDSQGKALQIIHRDVSPQNVLVSYEGEVKIIDFGIAKAASAVRSSKTQAGVLKGKFGYMSPEQVRGLPLDRRSDVFAIGTLLHEVLTGEKLFANDNDFTTLERVRNAAVDPPSRLNSDVPAGLDRIVMKALARDVEARYQWANEMQEELQQLMVKTGAMFSSKQLALWMKDAFAADLARERQQLEKFKRMGREAAPPPPPSSGLLDIVPGDATEVQDPVFGKSGPIAVGGAQRKATYNGAGAGSGGFGDEGPTSIFGGENPEPGAPRRALAAMLQSIDSAIPSPSGAPPTAPMRGQSASASSSALLPLPNPVSPSPTEPNMRPMAGETLPVPLPPPPPVSPLPVVPRTVERQSRPMPAVSSQNDRPSRPMGAVPAPHASAPVSTRPPPRLAQAMGGPPMRPAGAPTPLERPSRALETPPQAGERPSRPRASASPLETNERPSRPIAAVAFRSPPELDSHDSPIGSPDGQREGQSSAPAGVTSGRSSTGAFPATTMVPQVRQRPLGPSRRKIFAWVVGGLIVIGGLLVAAYFFGSRLLHHPPPPKPVVQAATTATLVASTGDDEGAEVLVNGQSRGSIPRGEKTLQIDGLAPGDAEVTLRRKNVPDCVTKVNLGISAANVVTCGFTAKLLLVVTNDGATVFVDKQEISAAAAREQMTLRAGQHEITVEKDGFEPQTIQLTLDPNEVREKRIELSAVEGKTPASAPAHATPPAVPRPHAATPAPEPPRAPAAVPVPAPTPIAPPPAPAPVPAPVLPEPRPVTPAEPRITGGGGEDSQSGTLSADSKPPARVMIDGHDTGKTTPSKIPLAPGKHKVTFVVGDQKFNYNIMVEPGQDYNLSKSLSVETGPDP